MINLTLSEEFKAKRVIQDPHFSYVDSTIRNRKGVSYSVLQRGTNDVLLIDSSGFLVDSIFAGLNEKHIEHIAKNGPRNYKDNLLKILQDQEMMRGVFDIAKSMDEDLGENVTRNQTRIQDVIQYIKDNQIAFEF